jgi:hypothetical protein
VTVTSGLAAADGDGGGVGEGVGAGVVGAGAGEGVGVVKVGEGAGGLAAAVGAAPDDDGTPVGATPAGAAAAWPACGERRVVVALPRCVELTGVVAGAAPDVSVPRSAQLTRPQEDRAAPPSARGVPPPDWFTTNPTPAPLTASTAAAVPAAYRPGPVIQELRLGRGIRPSSS